MTETTFNLVDEFKKVLDERFDNWALSRMYINLFYSTQILSKVELYTTLKQCQESFNSHPENWFSLFHKSIRQTDFYNNQFIKIVDRLTEVQHARRKVILGERIAARNKGEVLEPSKELSLLNHLMQTQEELSINGLFDSMLYNTIQLDTHGELKRAMELTFRVCS